MTEMKINTIGRLFFILISFAFLQGCLADIRPSYVKKSGITEANIEKGKSIIEAAWNKQGLNMLNDHEVYSYRGEDEWRKFLGKVGKPWPNAKSTIDFKYAIGSFDGSATFVGGKRGGAKAGLQSWQYYEQEEEGELVFKKKNKRIVFGLSAYQYFIEMLDRIKRVPIISYAGEKNFNGQQYDLVFATWHKAKPHRQNDQYVLWINKSSGMMEYVVYTLRENYLKATGTSMFYGSIHFSEYKDINGIKIPHTQTVFFNKPKKKYKKSLHQMRITDFKFDDFEISELYPEPSIEKVGDHKM